VILSLLYILKVTAMRNKLLAALLGLTLGTSAYAASVSLLKGHNFRDDLGYRKDKTTITIENFATWELGTVFFYYDITEPTTNYGQTFNDSKNSAYSNQFFGGISTTVSFSKVFKKEISYGPLKDVSLRLEIENGSGNGNSNFQNYFYGLQYDIAVPGFDFVSLNTVLRDNPNDQGVGIQIGGFWQMTHEWNRWSRFKFTGFFSTSPWNGDQDSDANTFFSKNGRYLTAQPQLLYDLGYGLWGKQNRLEVGVEYAYYINRFQGKDKDEKCLQYMAKVSF
jgi:nucleoside-specific outer membrane channel protein Tsx